MLLAAARGLVTRGHAVTVACCSGTRLESQAAEAGLDTVQIGKTWFGAGGALDIRKVLQEKFIEVAIVASERDHRIVGSAMRFASRGGVLRRIPSFDAAAAAAVGTLSLKVAPAGLLFSSRDEITEERAPGWAIPAGVAPIGVDMASYDAVDPIAREEIDAPPDGPLIVCDYDPSGRIRVNAVFRALALLAPRHPNIHAVVYGPGSDDDELRMHASAVGVGRMVSLLGERDDAWRIMRAGDAGWVVSGGDTGALACIDFMALRVPVIAERTPLAQHYIADGITGVLLTPDDAALTASAIAQFLSVADRRAAMGNAGRTRVQRDFTESAMIDGFEQACRPAGDRARSGRRDDRTADCAMTAR